MAPQSIKVNFHQAVGAEIQADRSEDLSFFAAEYDHHRVEALPAGLPQVILTFRRGAGPGKNPAGFSDHQHKVAARWSYRMQVSETEIHIEASGNPASVAMIHHMLLHPSLRYLAAQAGILMLHAGAVASQGRSLIFTGHGGAGKTTTTSLLLATGGPAWQPHADDYVFLAPGPRSLAYMTRSHLYKDLLRWVPEIAERMNGAERLRLEVYGRMRRWSREGIKLPVRLSMERLWPDRTLELSAVPAGLVTLKRSPVESPRLERIPPDEGLLETLVEMNFGEARHFLTLLEKNRALPDFNAWREAWRCRERELLQARCNEIPVYLLELPRHLTSPQAFRQMVARDLFEIFGNVIQPHVIIQTSS